MRGVRCKLKNELKLRWHNGVGIIVWLNEESWMHDCILAFHTQLSESAGIMT